MKYTFDLTEEDYLQFNMFTAKNYTFYQNQKKLFRILFTLLPFATGFGMWIFRGLQRPDIDFIVGYLVAVIPLSVLFWIGFPKFFDALTLRNAKRILFKEGKNNILGERILFFEEGSIRTSTKFEESSIQYGAITQMRQSDKAAYLYTAPTMALILPFRVFTDEESKQKCLAFIHTKLEENKKEQ